MKLNRMFQDGAVFQQNVQIPVWGTTEPWHKIKCEFAGQTIFYKANGSGNFMLRFAPVPAGGPYTLTVTDLNTSEEIKLQNILVGEVWIASGQSNMEYRLDHDLTVNVAREDHTPPIVNRQQEAEFCATIPANTQTRVLTIEKNANGFQEDTFKGDWKVLTPETAHEVSACAAWFGRFLQEKYNVPVGLIISSWGGTRAEAWTSRAGLRRNPDTAVLLQEIDNEMQQECHWDEKGQKPQNTQGICDPGNKGFEKGFANESFDDAAWGSIKIPGSWIRQKISGNGALWVRTMINIPSDWCDKDLVLELGGIDKHDTTYFNGVQIGKSGEGLDIAFWNKPRRYDIPKNAVHPGKNIIAIRAFSFMYDGAFLGNSDDYGVRVKGTDEFVAVTNEWKACAEVDFGILAPNDITPAPGTPNTPGILFDGMIRPLIPYAIRGAIWYQGESNARDLGDSGMYLNKMKAMVQDWRYYWELGDFPFIQVQLANFLTFPEPEHNAKSPWALLRENQLKLCKELPNVYMASAIDIGDSTDIHPQDKKNVGKRLAAAALHHVYHISDVVPSGPIYDNIELLPGEIRISFKYAEGLNVSGDISHSFYLAGNDGLFYPADNYRVEGISLVLSSEKVKMPCTVRYAWADDPKAVLFNGAGLPASPFRTDTGEITD